VTDPDLVRTVLVVEDHDLNRQLLTMLVEQQGQRALAAGSVAEVRARLTEAVPDIILMDVHLPDGDGLDLTAELRREERFDGVKIYAVTAYLMGETQERATAAGCDGLFEKPIDRDKLLPVLRR
jgi:CheY-like chemotaxis protein